jgi:hypothetical protein
MFDFDRPPRPTAVRLAVHPAHALGQAGNYVGLDDFRAYVVQANSSLKAVADIARAHDLSDDEKNAISTELNKVAGFTVPMARPPAPPPCPAPAACPPPAASAPAPAGEGIPVWAAVGGALVVGGLFAHLAL